MDFISTRNFDSEAEQVLWSALKSAFEHSEPGYCWHRYPVTSSRGQRLEPDILILHPEWGLNIIEVKGCSLDQIEAIEGHIWYMRDWYQDVITPMDQAERHMWSLVDRLKQFRYGILRDARTGECKLTCRAFVGLPYINEQEWVVRFGDHISAPKWQTIFATDLEVGKLTAVFRDAPVQKQMSLASEEWDSAVAVLKGSEALQTTPRRPTKRTDSKAAWLRQVEEKMKAFDLQQHRVAVQIPAGPQRIRGLAGTGKTVVLAQKAANMHVVNPEWDIVFTFYSRSLYDQVQGLIRKFVQEFSRGEIQEPDWRKIRVLYGWGSRAQQGLYRLLCEAMEVPFRTFDDAKRFFGTASGRVAFDRCCEELLSRGITGASFDAILIDEAQDFAENYFRLCYAVLRQPKRIVWGYDEVQSLEELEIPTADKLFGKDVNGNPLVDLDGLYPGEIEKDMILYHCYRNPRPVLVAAHAFGLGLRRRGGALQFIDTVGGWQDIGYEVRNVQDGRLQAGQEVTLHRPEANSPHLLEKLAGYQNLVKWRVFDSREQELDWIVSDIEHNIQHEELRPEEIVIIALDSRPKVVDQEYDRLFQGLLQKGISAIRIGTDTVLDVFRVPGSVTITSVFRAKGNEGSLVYVYGFENAGKRKGYDIVRDRNLAFTAMSRTKGWLELTGVGDVARELFNEVASILERIGEVSIVVPDMTTISRNLETYENLRRRKRTREAEKSIEKTIRDLADVNRDDLSPELRKQLYRLLFGDQPD